MVFTSLTFLFLFLPVTLAICHLTPKRWKTEVMLAVSILFLWSGGISAALLELILTAGTFGIGFLLEYLQKKGFYKRAGLVLAAVSIVYIAVLLFLRSSWVQTWKTTWISGADCFPFGLSFFVLQAIGYCADVRNGICDAERNWRKLSLYLLFYPRLIMGPVLSYSTAKKTLFQPTFSLTQTGSGFLRVLIGLAKKLLLADWVEMLYINIVQSDPSSYSILILWVGAFSKLMALYLELSGYADMAVGLAQCYGIKLPESYSRSLFYPTIRQFMEQWNKTVVQWFAQYVGTHLPGKNRFFRVMSVMLTWGCIGLWYECRLSNFLVGLLFGLFIGIECLMKKRNHHTVSYLSTIILCSAGAAVLSSSSSYTGLTYLKGMIGMGHLMFTDADGALLLGNWLVFLAALYVTSGNWQVLMRKAARQRWMAKWTLPLYTAAAVILLLLDVTMLFADGGSVGMQILL